MATGAKPSFKNQLKDMEQRWLRADAACNQAREVLRCAQQHQQNGREGEASILVDASLVCLDKYVGE